MADKTIADLTAASSVISGDLFEIQRAASSLHVTSDQISSFVSTNIGSTIYTGDGTITGTRQVSIANASQLAFSGVITSALSSYLFISIGTLEIDGFVTNIYTPTLNISSTSINLTASQFVGAGTQYLTVDNSGQVIPLLPSSIFNIYNSDGTLTGSRTVTLSGNELFFVGSAGSSFQVSAPQVTFNGAQATISSSNITFDATQFVSHGTQWLTADNTGNIIPVSPPLDTNIYNTDGTLTGNRTLSLGGHNLLVGSSLTSLLELNTSGFLQLTSSSSMMINSDSISIQATTHIGVNSDAVTLGASPSSLTTVLGGMRFASSPFTGGGNQFLGVNNTGNVTLLTPIDTNIYNTDGSLSGARNLNTNGFDLSFTGTTGNFLVDVPQMYVGWTAGNAFTIGSNTFQGIANSGSQVLGGKFNVVLNDDTGIYSNTFVRFSDSLPVTMVLAKSRGTEAAPTIIQDGDLLGVFAFAGGDGTTYSGLPNFNLGSGIFCIAAPGQAVANTPAALLFNVNTSGNSIGSTFMAFNVSGNGESLFGQGASSTGTNGIVLGNNISSALAEEVLVGTTNVGGTVRIAAPAINLDAPAISLIQSPYSGSGNQYLTVDNAGLIVPVAVGSDINIYNSNGALTGARTVDLNGFTLQFGTSFAAEILIDPAGDIKIGTNSSVEIDAPAVNLGSNTHALNIFNNTVQFWASSFVGHGTSYLTVDNSGFLTPVAAPTSINIYNSDGSLTGNRGVTMGGNILLFSGNTTGSTLSNFEVTSGYINFNGLTTVITSTNLNISTPNISLLASQFVGSGTQFLTVNNSGLIVPSAGTSGTNIYNSDGSLTGNRVVTLGSNTLSFSGVGGVNFGSGSTATASCSFSQGNTNAVTSINSIAMGGLLNTVNGVDSACFVSNGCTVSLGSGTAGYGVMIGAYNCIGFDNQTLTMVGVNAVNNGQRSVIIGGQTNKINAPNTVASSDCFISGGNTNTITGDVTYATIAQSDSCIVGDNTNSLASTWIMNSVSGTYQPNSSIGNSNMVDLNGTNNTLQSHYAFLINCKNNNITSSTFGLGGRYFMANAVNYSIPAGNYVGALNSVGGTLNGNYCTQLSSNLSQFGSTALYSSILGGDTNVNNGTRSSILCGLGNTINNINSSAAIGSAITINHDSCILINDGNIPLTSANNATILIQAANGISLGTSTNNPNRDVVLGKRLGVYSVGESTNFATASVQAVMYLLTASVGSLIVTLSDADKVSGVLLIFKRVAGVNNITLSPQSGTLNGGGPAAMSDSTIITSDGANWYTVCAV